ncbi:MAG: hypothetical protein WC824_07965, partial [Bacteroidota bacterium]
MAQNSVYLPPAVYTDTNFQAPTAASLESLKIPVFIGEGNEYLIQQQLDVVRGSSATVDQKIVSEDETGRMVVSISPAGVITLGNYDGVLDRFQVSHFPITSGDGSGTATTNRSDVQVTINGDYVVIRTVDGTRGIVQVSQPPNPGDVVRCTYFFKRTDTLITDNVSEQVDPNPAVVYAMFGIGDVNAPNHPATPVVLDLHDDVLDAFGQVTSPANNILSLTVDGSTSSIRITPRTNYTMAQVASAITAARVGTLVGGTFVDNYGHSALKLTATNSLTVLEGSANGLLGLVNGQVAPRVATFYTFQGPIVTGTGGGVTATDPSQVVVKVNGQQVIPYSVDGANRAVTLPVAPAAGAVVTLQYYFNSWQDTFDYLAHVGVSQVVSCGDCPDSTSYNQGADFILQNDRIMWGTAVSTESGVHTDGSTYFGTSQITTLLVDNRTFLSECSAVVVSGSASQTTFQLPFDPTLGNGRDTPLGQSLFQTVSNSRIDLPVNRPDVVWAYWGWDVQDALERGKVVVLKVEGNVITLSEPIPVGARLFATFYYNTLTDETYTLSCVVPGASGIGTYTMTKTGDVVVFGPSFSTGTKGSSLNGVTLEWPSGSELTPDLHFEGMSGNSFTGPVTETVTVQIASRQATPARYTAPDAGPYEFINGQSDHLRLKVHAQDITSTVGLDLDNPSDFDGGFFASLVGNEVVYPNGQTYNLPASEEVLLTLDGVDVLAKTNTGLMNVDVGAFSDAINEAACGHQSLADDGGADYITLDPTLRSNITDRYKDWVVVLGDGGAGTSGESRTVTAYNGATGVATVAAWSGAPVATDPYYIYDPAARAALEGATVFTGPVTLAKAKHNNLHWVYHGDVTGAAVPLAASYIASATAVAVGTATVGAVGAGDTLSIKGVPFVYNIAPNPALQQFSTAANLVTAIMDGASQILLLAAIGFNAETVSATASGSVVTISYSVAGYHGLLVTLQTNDVVNLPISGGTGVGPYPLAFPAADYTFATVNDLADGVSAAIAIAVADIVDSNSDFAGLRIVCSANSDNKLEFVLQLPGLDSAGYLCFMDSAVLWPNADFCVLAGLDTSNTEGGGQAVLLQGPVAKTYECPATGALKPYDRMVLRNRIMPGGGPIARMNASSVVSQTELSVKAASDKTGLAIGMYGLAERTATVKAASLASHVSLTGGFDSNAEVLLTFYDGSGSHAANDTFSFTLDGYAVNAPLSQAVGTVTIGAGIVVPATVTIAGVVFTYDAAPVVANQEFDTATNLAAAINHANGQALLIAAINKPASAPTETVSAAAVGTVCTITYSVSGPNGSLVTLATNDSVNVTLSGATLSAGSGTVRPLGPATIASHATVLDQIQDALAALAGAPFGTRAAIFASQIVRQEGLGIRITGLAYDTTALVSIGSGNANSTLGFSSGQIALRSTVPAKILASAFNSARTSDFQDYMFDFTATEEYFAKYGLASIQTDTTGLEYLYVQDAPTLVAGLGAASTLEFSDPSPNTANALFYGTLLGVIAGEGAIGEA